MIVYDVLTFLERVVNRAFFFVLNVFVVVFILCCVVIKV